MTLAALIIAALALGVAAVAVWLAVVARADALTCRRELARHREAHANAAEERRAVRHRAPEPEPARPAQQPEPDTGPPTSQIDARDLPTREARVVLPRPGRTAR